MKVTDRDSAERADSLAHELDNSGRVKEALALWQQVVEFDPDFSSGAVFTNIANCQETLGNIAEAKKAYGEAVRREPGYEFPIRNYAAFLEDHGTVEEAYAAFVALASVERYHASLSALTQATISRLAARLQKSDSEVEGDLNAATSNLDQQIALKRASASQPAKGIALDLVNALKKRYSETNDLPNPNGRV